MNTGCRPSDGIIVSSSSNVECARPLPLVNTLGMKVGSEKTFGAGSNVLPVWKKRLDSKTLVTTPNSDVIDAMGYVDLGKDGPLVFEAPPNLQGILLDAGRTYRLAVPQDVPVAQFWSVTVYDNETCCFVNTGVSPDRSSRDAIATNAEGSVDITFGPTPPVDVTLGGRFFGFSLLDRSLRSSGWR